MANGKDSQKTPNKFCFCLFAWFSGGGGGGRQGLCDYEGHLIVRSFHGEGEGLHNYMTATLCYAWLQGALVCVGMHWLWAVSILKTYLCFVLATCGCSGPCRGGGQAATIMTKFLYNYDKVFYNYDKVLL
jgi:hypothetical protein